MTRCRKHMHVCVEYATMIKGEKSTHACISLIIIFFNFNVLLSIIRVFVSVCLRFTCGFYVGNIGERISFSIFQTIIDICTCEKI